MRIHLPAAILLYMILVSISHGYAQGRCDTLAKVNGQFITAPEYLVRYRSEPAPPDSTDEGMGMHRREFLLSLIAENVLAEEAISRRYDTMRVLRRLRETSEGMLVRDYLYRKQFRDRFAASDRELRARTRKTKGTTVFRFVLCTTPEECTEMETRLGEGIAFDSLPDHGTDGLKSVEDFSFTEDPRIAEELRQLEPGEISRPLRVNGGYCIAQRIERIRNRDREELLRMNRFLLAAQIRQEKEAVAAAKFVRKLRRKHKVVTHKDSYKEVSRIVRSRFADVSPDEEKPNESIVGTVQNPSMEEQGYRSSETCVRIGRDTVTLGDCIDWFATRLQSDEKIPTDRYDDEFKKLFQSMVDDQLVAKEGYRRGYLDSLEVRQALSQLLNPQRARILLREVVKEFLSNDDSLWNYYVRNPRMFGPPMEIKILEILHESGDTLAKLLPRIKAGGSMRALAAEYTRRQDAIDRDGERGYFDVTKYPLIGRAALDMRVFQLSPILESEEGYVLFRLLDLRKQSDSTVSSIADIRSQIERRWMRSVSRFVRYKLLYDLVMDADVAVYDVCLESLPITETGTPVKRNCGFGGVVPHPPAVVPLALPVMEAVSRKGSAHD